MRLLQQRSRTTRTAWAGARLSSRTARPAAQLLLPVMLAHTLVLGACGSGGDGAPTPPIAPVASLPVLTRIALSTDAPSLPAGQSLAVLLAAFDAHGLPMTVGTPAWSSSDATVASISAAGVVTALATGTTEIVARVGIVQGQLSLRVTPSPTGALPVAAIVVTPNAASLESGQEVQLEAILSDVTGRALTPRPLTWTTSDSAVATVSATGRVSARDTGTVIITAAMDSIRGATAIGVSAPPDTDILVSFASPVPGVVVGDTLKVEVAVRTIARTDSVWATVGAQRTPLAYGPIGSRASGWSATLQLATLTYGPYVLRVTALDSRGHRGVALLAFERNPKALGGSKNNPTSNK